MERLIAWILLGCVAGLAESAAGQVQNQPNSIGRTLPTGMPVELPKLEKSGHMPEDPDEIAPPATAQQMNFNAAEARKNAHELAALAQKIPGEVDQLSKNILPKDLVQQLKQIEKLSKRLRAELSR